MDLKVRCERLNPVCHGCLSVDRKLSRISGEFLELFHKIRNESSQAIVIQQIQLCWECLAFLKKWKMYQTKVQNAQQLLLQCLQSYYVTNGKSKPNSLSSLKNIHINQYNVHLNHDQEQITVEIEPFNENLEKSDQVDDKKDITTLIHENADIKQESADSMDAINNDSDTNNSDKEIEVKRDDTDSENSVQQTNNSGAVLTIYLQSKYSSYAIKLKRNLSDVKLYTKTVCLSQKKYESYMIKNKNKYGRGKMPYKCNECNLRFSYKLDILRHKSFNHNDQTTYPYKCLACTTMITSEDHLEKHWTSSHTLMLKCTLCTDQKLFKTLGEVKKHVKKIHHTIYTCSKCRTEFRTRNEFLNHYMYIHDERGTFICDFCNKSFDKRRAIIAHIKFNHMPEHCKICSRTYINRKNYVYHNQITHPELIFGETSKELAYCVECDKQYPNERKYKLHLKSSVKHMPAKKKSVPCPDCGKIYSKTHFMKNHYRFAHLKVTKHHCEICNKYFTNGFGLRTHIKRVHNKIALPKDKICDICGRGFSVNKTLINHRRTHTGERPHKCEYCPAAFAQETAMKTHQKTQHKNVNLELNTGSN